MYHVIFTLENKRTEESEHEFASLLEANTYAQAMIILKDYYKYAVVPRLGNK